MHTALRRTAAAAVLAAALPAAATAASVGSMTYSVSNITGNSIVNTAAGESQLSFTLASVDAQTVAFTFNNAGPAAMSITQIYFENGDGLLDGIYGIDNGSGSSLAVSTKKNLNLPGGNSLADKFDAVFGVAAQAPVQPSGIGAGDSATIRFTLAPNADFAGLAAAIGTSTRVGFHVQGFANGGSESFIGGPPTAVPSPSALGLGGLMIGGLLARRRRGTR